MGAWALGTWHEARQTIAGPGGRPRRRARVARRLDGVGASGRLASGPMADGSAACIAEQDGRGMRREQGTAARRAKAETPRVQVRNASRTRALLSGVRAVL